MNIKGKILLSLMLAALFLSAAHPVIAGETKSDDYFPMKVGNWWKYSVPRLDGELIVKITGEEKVGKYKCFLVEFYQNGKLTSQAYYTRKGNKILIVGGKDTKTRVPKKYKKPHVYLEYPLSVGKSWKIKDTPMRGNITVVKKVEKQEKIKVPAGEFDCLFVTEKPADIHGSNEVWYAKGVGAVRMSIGRGKAKLDVPLVEYNVK